LSRLRGEAELAAIEVACFFDVVDHVADVTVSSLTTGTFGGSTAA
jgi:hypothetical protein